MNNIITNFISGGLIVSLVSLLTQYTSSLIGALVWSYPFTLIPVLYYLNETNHSHIFLQSFLEKTLFSTIILFIALLSLYIFYSFNNSLLYSVMFSTLVWLILCIIIYKIDMVL